MFCVHCVVLCALWCDFFFYPNACAGFRDVTAATLVPAHPVLAAVVCSSQHHSQPLLYARPKTSTHSHCCMLDPTPPLTATAVCSSQNLHSQPLLYARPNSSTHSHYNTARPNTSTHSHCYMLVPTLPLTATTTPFVPTPPLTHSHYNTTRPSTSTDSQPL